MQIRQVILKGVRNFQDFKCSFEDEWNSRVSEALLLIGPNGSGKTTLLNVIAELWQLLGNLLNEGERPLLPGPTLKSCEFAAIEIVGLESKPIWLIFRDSQEASEWRQIATEQLDTYRIIFSQSSPIFGNEDSAQLDYFEGGPGNLYVRRVVVPVLSGWMNGLKDMKKIYSASVQISPIWFTSKAKPVYCLR